MSSASSWSAVNANPQMVRAKCLCCDRAVWTMYNWLSVIGVCGGVVVVGDDLTWSEEASLGNLWLIRWRNGVGGEFVDVRGVLDGEERRLCAK